MTNYSLEEKVAIFESEHITNFDEIQRSARGLSALADEANKPRLAHRVLCAAALGACFYRRLNLASTYIDTAERYAEHITVEAQAVARNIAGTIKMFAGDLSDAIPDFEAAMALASKSDKRNIYIAAAANTSCIFGLLGDYETAISQLQGAALESEVQASESLALKINILVKLTWMQSNAAEHYHSTGDISQAHDLAAQCLASGYKAIHYLTQLYRPRAKLYISECLARACLLLDKTCEAINWASQASQLSERLCVDSEDKGILGEILVKTASYASATPYLLAGFEYANKYAIHEFKIRYAALIAENFAQLSQYEESSAWFMRCREMEITHARNKIQHQLNLRQYRQSQRHTGAFQFLVHDLRSPISTQLSVLDQVLTKMSATDKARSSLEEARSLAFRELLMIQEHLTYQRLDDTNDLTLVPTLFSECMENACATMQMRAKLAQVKIEVSDETDAMPVHIEPALLEKAIVSLLDNAVKVSSASSTIRIMAKVEMNNLTVKVQDEGPGFPEQVRSAMYFGRTQGHSRQGYGLGLSLVHKVVDMHKGRISITALEPRGSCVSLIVPAHQVSATIPN